MIVLLFGFSTYLHMNAGIVLCENMGYTVFISVAMIHCDPAHNNVDGMMCDIARHVCIYDYFLLIKKINE
uniref:Uncharacterized protein n=1 Tax=Setaria italica TaxID=4555 RepID=K3ZG49_SETIT